MDRDKLVFNPPELGCVLYLPGLPGGGSTIYDRSPYGNEGTIVNGATWTFQNGLWVLSFDGTDDKITTGLTPNINPSTQAYTISVWAKATDKGTMHSVWGTSLGTNQRMYLGAESLTTDKWQLTLEDGTNHNLLSSATISYGSWVNVVTVFNGAASAELFVNTVSQGTVVVPSYTTTGALVIGDIGTAGVYFLGSIGLPRVFNVVLTPFQILNIYNREKNLFGV